MSLIRTLLWGLAAMLAAFLFWRLVRAGFWLITRPGGWIVLACAALLAAQHWGTPVAAR
ncbi:hypothetical protein [Frigidibacter oleivorans]|uniref:hypothetical protein n=1 Tax=Frigidibacter oleivorans TaxID=2487129 RepID=UPI0013DFBCED|nr:hypothetical protein [Frigidibacter oleivorans]